MKSQATILISGLLFAALAFFSYQLFGWTLDGWILAGAGVVHLAVVINTYPRLDPFLVGVHYTVALAGLGGVAWILLDVVGWASGAGGVLGDLLQHQWSESSSYFVLCVYVVLVTGLFLVLVVAISWLLYHRFPRRHEVLVGLFVASLLNIPCDFALVDPLSQVVVLDPEASQAFIFATGLLSLELPMLLHGLIAVFVGIAWRGWRAPRSARRPELAHPPGED